MKKYEFVELRNYGTWKDDKINLRSSFQDLTEKGYHYHSFLPGSPSSIEGSMSSIILVFEKDVKEESNEDF